MFPQLLLVPVAALVMSADPSDDAKKHAQKLEGVWVLVSGEVDGKKVADEHVKASKIVWKDGAVTVVTPHQSKDDIKTTTKLDPGKKPAEMSWVRSSGPGTGKEFFAIYEFIDDDQYRICFAAAGEARPKEFASKLGSGHTLHVWKRVKP